MYIQYTLEQLSLPMDLEEDIPGNHLVRVVNAAVNRLDDKIFAEAYSGGDRDSRNEFTPLAKLPKPSERKGNVWTSEPSTGSVPSV